MKRIAIYTYSSKTGTIGDYALFFIKSLLEVADEIIFVACGKFSTEELSKIQNSRVQIIENKNEEAGFLAYGTGFSSIGSDKIQNFDELIFANSNTFGPFYPFYEMFRKMASKDLDFWGVTKCRTDKHPSGLMRKCKNTEYLQSYFLVFRQKMFLTHYFKNYVENLRKIKPKKENIARIEAGFTEYFSRLGFMCGSFVDESILDFEIDNYSRHLPDILVKDYKVPLIEKSALGEGFDLAQQVNFGDKAFNLFNFLKENTQYDTTLISKEITKNYPMDEIKRFLHLNFILQNSCRENFLNGRPACIIEPMGSSFSLVESHLENFSGLVDFYSISPIKRSKLKITPLNSTVSVFGQIKKLALKYDYFLIFLPNQLLLRDLAPIVKKDYLTHLLNCALASKIYLSNITNTLKKNPEIGVLTPTPFVFSEFDFPKEFVFKKDIEDFLQKSNLNLKVNPKFLNTIPNCFWITKQLIADIEDIIDFEANTPLNLGMIFSLLAQKYGFLTATAAPPFVAAKYIDVLECAKLKSSKYITKSGNCK